MNNVVPLNVHLREDTVGGVVLDASASVEWLLNRPGAHVVESAYNTAEEVCHVPGVFATEMVSVARGLALGGKIDVTRADAMIEDLISLDLAVHDSFDTVPRVWELRNNFSAYDASYVALAESLKVTLLTADARIERAVSDLGLDVDVDVVNAP